jgi:hypothetical protein
MISTIVASLPSEGPPVMRTILPTSTSLHDDAVISASPIVIDSEVKLLAERFGTFEIDFRTYWALCRGFRRLLEEVSLGDKFEIQLWTTQAREP